MIAKAFWYLYGGHRSSKAKDSKAKGKKSESRREICNTWEMRACCICGPKKMAERLQLFEDVAYEAI